MGRLLDELGLKHFQAALYREQFHSLDDLRLVVKHGQQDGLCRHFGIPFGAALKVLDKLEPRRGVEEDRWTLAQNPFLEKGKLKTREGKALFK
jgi:hypothetical protein